MTDLTGARTWLNVLMQAANGCADNSWEQAQVRAETFNALRQGEFVLSAYLAKGISGVEAFTPAPTSRFSP